MDKLGKAVQKAQRLREAELARKRVVAEQRRTESPGRGLK